MPKKNAGNKKPKKGADQTALLPAITKKTKKKGKKKNADGAWSKTKRKVNQNPDKKNVAAFRFKQASTFSMVDANGNSVEEKIRNAMLIDEDILLPLMFNEPNKKLLREDFHHRISKKFKEKAPTSRVVKEIIAVDPKTQSPVKVKVISPTKPKGGKKPNYYVLVRVEKVNGYHIFSNDPTLVPLLDSHIEVKIDPKAKIPKAVKPNKKPVKQVKNTVTSKSLKKAKKEIAENNGRRCMSQNKVMAAEGFKEKEASATIYRQKLGLVDQNTPSEWLHEESHEEKGNAAQVEANLVAGGKECNSLMIPTDSKFHYLTTIYPQFDLEVNAEMIPGNKPKEFTQAAKMIERRIITADFENNEKFNVFTENKPHKDYGEFFGGVLESQVEYTQEKKKKLQPKKLNMGGLAQEGILFFKRDGLKAKGLGQNNNNNNNAPAKPPKKKQKKS